MVSVQEKLLHVCNNKHDPSFNMTKIAYMRAINSQQQQAQQVPPSISPTKPKGMIKLQPMIPSMMPSLRPVFNGPARINQQNQPKPINMTPTTRFNTNPNVLIFDQQNGGRISKPLMEKRRRARINQCLSQLKTIVVDSAGQHTQNNKCKLEKADILELTVNYVKKLHQEHQQQQQQQQSSTTSPTTVLVDRNGQQFLAGYQECMRQISDHLNHGPSEVDFDLNKNRQSIMDFLQQCLSRIQQSNGTTSAPTTTTTFPPSPTPSSESNMTMASSGDRKRCYQQSFRSDEEEEEEEEEGGMTDYEDEDDDFLYSDPLNLKVVTVVSADSIVDEDVWRPW